MQLQTYLCDLCSSPTVGKRYSTSIHGLCKGIAVKLCSMVSCVYVSGIRAYVCASACAWHLEYDMTLFISGVVWDLVCMLKCRSGAQLNLKLMHTPENALASLVVGSGCLESHELRVMPFLLASSLSPPFPLSSPVLEIHNGFHYIIEDDMEYLCGSASCEHSSANGSGEGICVVSRKQ